MGFVRVKLIIILTIVVMSLTSVSCRRCTTLIYNPEDQFYQAVQFSTLAGQWQYIWQAMDNNYVFWDIDDTDWDALYNRYLRRFRDLDELLDSLDEECRKGNLGPDELDSINHAEMYDLMGKELAVDLGSLVDQHLTMRMCNPHNDNRPYEIQPLGSRLARRPDYHKTVTNSQAQRDNPAYNGVDYIYDAIKSYYGVAPYCVRIENSSFRWMYACCLEGGIMYLRMGGYFLSEMDDLPDVKDLVKRFLAAVSTAVCEGNLLGIILDNRGNTGGYVNDLNLIPGVFMSDTVKILEKKTKNGLGRYDYSPMEECRIAPAKETIDIGNAPFVIIQDMNSVSMGEVSGYACTMTIPTAIIIGERSAGALGELIPDYPDIFHSGPVNYHTESDEPYIYTSTYSSLMYSREDKTWKSLEGIGIEPDIYCRLDYDALADGGRDTQLDRAVKYILSGK